MLKYTSLIFVGLFGCVDAGPPLDLSHRGPHATVYDDGTTLRVTGCSDGAGLGCTTPAFGVTMSVTAGGVVHDVPQSTEGAIDDQLLNLFGDGPFQLTLPRPADAQLGIEIAGATAQIELPPAFAIDPVPSAVAHRENTELTITYEVLPDATTSGVIVSTCGPRIRTGLGEETHSGVMEITFDPTLTGVCTHDIHVDQRTRIAGEELGVDAIRIERVTVTSNP